MPAYADVQSFGPYTLNAGVLSGVTAHIEADGTEPVTADVQYQERPANAAEFSQATTQPNAIVVRFSYQGYAAKANILRILNFPQNTAPQVIRAYMGDDDDPTLCFAEVAASEINVANAGHIDVTFQKADPYWRKVTASQLSDTASNVDRSFTAAGAIILHNEGHVRVGPTYRLKWSAQRTTFSADVGWRYRRQVTITNNGDADWHEEPIPLDLGDTAAWVTATKAQADGDDIRVWFEGDDLARTLVNPNTRRTFAWVLVTCPSGESVTLDVVYGNSAATAPATLSTRTGEDQTYVAFDLEGDSGEATSGSTTTLTITGAGWETDRWKGGFCYMVNSGGTSTRARRIASNTGDTLTFERALSSSSANTPFFMIWMSGVFCDGGRPTTVAANSITDNAHTTKWGVNALQGATVRFLDGTANPTTMTVLSNTADQLTFTGSFVANPTVGDNYIIERLGVWSYVVDTALTDTVHRDLYRMNRYYTQPSRVWSNGDTPGGWQVDTYLPNNDDYAQFKPFNTGSGGGHSQNWRGTLRTRRRRGQERTYKNEKNGDGMSLSSAFCFQAAYFDWQVKNVNGVGKAVFAIQESGGESWVDVVSYTTTQATLTAVAAQWADLSGYESPTHLGMFALPADTDEQGNIPSTAKDDDEVEVRTNDVLRVILDLDSFGGLSGSRYVVGSEVEIYDLSASIRIGGGNEDDKTPPYDVIAFGGDGHKIGLRSTEELWVSVDPSLNRPLFAIYDTVGGGLTAAAWAGVIDSYELDIDGDAEAIVAMELASLPAGLNLVENGDFRDADVSMWTMTPGVGVTATKAYAASPALNGAGAMEIDITATPVGAWDITLELPAIAVLPGMAYPFGFYRRTDDNGNSIDAEMTIIWGGTAVDLDQTIGGAFAANDTWYHDADSNFTHDVPPGMVSVDAPTTEASISIVISGTGSYTGKVYLSRITLGVPAAHITEPEMGTLVFDAVWREAFLG